jgi:hypothetical protein
MKNLTVIFLFIFSVSAQAGDFPQNWYTLPENSSLDTEVFQKNNVAYALVETSIGDSFTQLVNNVEAIVPEPTVKKKGEWNFAGFITQFSLGASGDLGLLSFGGTKSVEILYERNLPQITKKIHSSSPTQQQIISVSPTLSEEELKRLLFSSVDHFYEANDKLKQKAKSALLKLVTPFHQLSQKLSFQKARFTPGKIILEAAIDGSGNVLPYLEVGAGVAILIQWQLIAPKNSQIAMRRCDDFTSMDNIASDLSHAYEAFKATEDNSKFQLEEIRLGLGVAVNGSIAIMNASAGVKAWLYLLKNEPTNVADTYCDNGDVMLIANNSQHVENFAHENAIEFKRIAQKQAAEFKIPRHRFRKGLEKVFKIAEHFMHKSEMRDASEHKWRISEITTTFEFSVSGSTALTSVASTPTLELLMTRKGL